MATNQSAYVNLDAQATSTKNGRSTTVSLKPNRQFQNGTLANLADKSYYDQITIVATGSPQNLDFNGAGLIDSNGDAMTWVDMVFLAVKADSANTVNITIGNGTNPFDFGAGATGTMVLKPGETKVLINIGADPGYAITAGSADAIKFFIASGSNQVFEILAFGRSA